jgi:curved DNA-binding protein CbpA
MDFYEELGVPRSASRDEIRSAYRQRARLLHPDRYSNAALRAIAEAEMRRVNAIAGLLTHPQERLLYDRTLIGEGVAAGKGREPIARSQPSRRRLDTKVAFWLVAGAATSLICILALAFDSASAPAVPLVAASSAPAARAYPAQPESIAGRVPLSPLEGKQRVDTDASAVDIAGPKLPPSLPRSETTGADRPLSPPAPAPAISDSRPAKPVVELHIDTADAPAPLRPEEIRPAHRGAGLVGLWRYGRSGQGQALPGSFEVQEVEVGITRQFGEIYGYYEGRYVVPQGRAPTEVSFQFSGTMQNESARTTWSSNDGSRGEIALRMLSEDSLEVVWVASHLGRPGRVASGRITLARVE